MSEPDHGRSTQAERDIIVARKQANNDRELRAHTTEPLPPPEAVNATSPLSSPFGASGGAGYKIDPEAIAAQIRTFESLRDRIADQRSALFIASTSVQPPSTDAPAVSQAAATKTSLTQAANDNLAMRDYIQGLIDALRKANGTYQRHDEDTGALFEKRSAE